MCTGHAASVVELGSCYKERLTGGDGGIAGFSNVPPQPSASEELFSYSVAYWKDCEGEGARELRELPALLYEPRMDLDELFRLPSFLLAEGAGHSLSLGGEPPDSS